MVDTFICAYPDPDSTPISIGLITYVARGWKNICTAYAHTHALLMSMRNRISIAAHMAILVDFCRKLVIVYNRVVMLKIN